jgi:hypothetical protein
MDQSTSRRGFPQSGSAALARNRPQGRAAVMLEPPATPA